MRSRSSVKLSFGLSMLIIGFLLGYAAFYFTQPVQYQSQNVSVIEQPVMPVSTQTVRTNVVAVTEDGKGILGIATLEFVPGHGRILISANPFIEPDTQYSVEMAKSAAERLTGKSLAKNDIIISFNLSAYDNTTDTRVIGGPSAGLPIALAIVAGIENVSLPSNISSTGTIDSDGSVGKVGAVLEKAEAAAKSGMNLFLVPAGQGNVTYYEKQVEERTMGRFTITRIIYVPKSASLNNYTMQWNMSTYEVKNLAEAVKIAMPELQLKISS
jgi:predicted S18 family serine protease